MPKYDVLPVWLAYPNRRYVPAKVRTFIDYLCENIGPVTGAASGPDRRMLQAGRV